MIYVKVGTLNRLEPSKICVLNFTTLGIAMLTIQHYIIFSVCVMKYHRDDFIQTSPDDLADEECAVYISQT